MASIRKGLVTFGFIFLGCLGVAQASVEEISDDALAEVHGEDGVTIMLHLEWNANALTAVDLNTSSSITVGFNDFALGETDPEKGNRTYLSFQGFGGIVDLWSLKIDAKAGPADVGDYVEITLPTVVGFKDFGVRALYAHTSTTSEPTASYGKWILNGSAAITGSMYVWPAK